MTDLIAALERRTLNAKLILGFATLFLIILGIGFGGGRRRRAGHGHRPVAGPQKARRKQRHQRDAKRKDPPHEHPSNDVTTPLGFCPP